MSFDLKEIGFNLLLNIINIIILFVIVKLIVYKPVKDFLDKRKAKIAEDTQKAEKLMETANETLSEKDRLIEEGRRKGEELATKAYEEARLSADSIINEAKKDAKEIKQKAEAEIVAEKENMIKSSKNEIAELSVSIAEKILSREINDKDNQKIVDDFFAEV